MGFIPLFHRLGGERCRLLAELTVMEKLHKDTLAQLQEAIKGKNEMEILSNSSVSEVRILKEQVDQQNKKLQDAAIKLER